MIRAAVIGLLLFTAALLQTALFPYLAIGGYRPDLLVLLTGLFALRDGPVTGVIVGFAAGMLADLLLVQPALGVTAVVYVAIAYAVGVARPYLAVDSITAPIVVVFGSALTATAGYGILSRLLGDPRFTISLVVVSSLFVALYNTLLAPIFIAIVRWVSERFPPERTAPL